MYKHYFRMITDRKRYNSYSNQKSFRNLDLEDMENLQWIKLKELLMHTYDNSLYYRNLWDSLQIRIEEISCYDDLKIIPFTSKKIYRENFEDIIIKSEMEKGYSETSTSGSSGEPFVFLENIECKINNSSSNILNEEYWGMKPNKRRNILTIKRLHHEVKKKNNLITKLKRIITGKKIRIEAHDISEAKTPEIVKLINSEKFDLMEGFTSPIVALCRNILRLKLDAKIPFTTIRGEGLPVAEEKIIELALSSKVFRGYGSSECQRMGFQNVNNYKAYFLDLYNYYFEFLPLKEKDMFELVVTNLNNNLFPIIRYRIGDFVKLINTDKNSDFAFPQVEVIGRIFDTIMTPKNKELTVFFFAYIFEYQSDFISQFRVVQTAIDIITIQIVPIKKIPSKLLENLRTEISEYTENTMTIIFEELAELPLDSSGKIKLINSLKK